MRQPTRPLDLNHEVTGSRLLTLEALDGRYPPAGVRLRERAHHRVLLTRPLRAEAEARLALHLVHRLVRRVGDVWLVVHVEAAFALVGLLHPPLNVRQHLVWGGLKPFDEDERAHAKVLIADQDRPVLLPRGLAAEFALAKAQPPLTNDERLLHLLRQPAWEAIFIALGVDTTRRLDADELTLRDHLLRRGRRLQRLGDVFRGCLGFVIHTVIPIATAHPTSPPHGHGVHGGGAGALRLDLRSQLLQLLLTDRVAFDEVATQCMEVGAIQPTIRRRALGLVVRIHDPLVVKPFPAGGARVLFEGCEAVLRVRAIAERSGVVLGIEELSTIRS